MSPDTAARWGTPVRGRAVAIYLRSATYLRLQRIIRLIYHKATKPLTRLHTRLHCQQR